MKPKSKVERRVAELSATLQPLRESDFQKMLSDYKRTYHNKGLSYYLVLERCKEFQVIRYYYLRVMRKRTDYRFFEFCRVFLNRDNKIVMAKDRFPMCVDAWKEESEFSIKHWFNPKYEYTYLGGMDRLGYSGSIVRTILPELRQKGMRTSCHAMNPYKLCAALLTNNRIETLFKLKQYRLVDYLTYNMYSFDDKMWQTIRVALRHGYHWDSNQELKDWMDLIHDLRALNLDTNNPHYICPANLHDAHQHWIEVRRKFHEKEEKEREKQLYMEQIKNAKSLLSEFRSKRECFDDMIITDGEINITVIPTPQDMVEEGYAMHHCVGSYIRSWDSLILSAKIGGMRVETIEVALTTFDVVQSRGVDNEYTKYHDRIVKLMKDNINEIKKRYRKQLKKAV